MTVAVDLLWYSASLSSMEHFRYRNIDSRRSFGGTVLASAVSPATITYSLDVDTTWHLRSAQIDVSQAGVQVTWEISRSGDKWLVNGTEQPDLSGCTDLDLAWTPSTNTIPIRRTQLEMRESTTILAAWLSFPELELRPVEQRYERIGARLWRYESSQFAADLIVDDQGLVLRYGSDLWAAVATPDDLGRSLSR